jgi:hypothetical protein
LYVGDGVRGGTNGFHVSVDGGKTWNVPQAFKDFAAAGGSSDVYHVEPDPADFNHVLITFHSPWANADSTVIESFDGGSSFKKSNPVGGAFAGGYDVYFLYDPVLGIGDAKTWLFGTQGKGHHRTTDAGQSWTQVTDVNMQHGGGTTYYTQNKVLYISSERGVLRSTDNGSSFTQVSPTESVLSVIGDGQNLYTGRHFNSRFITAPESDDTKWTELSAQDFDEGPFQMAVDSTHRILYSANIRAGVWALKL